RSSRRRKQPEQDARRMKRCQGCAKVWRKPAYAFQMPEIPVGAIQSKNQTNAGQNCSDWRGVKVEMERIRTWRRAKCLVGGLYICLIHLRGLQNTFKWPVCGLEAWKTPQGSENALNRAVETSSGLHMCYTELANTFQAWIFTARAVETSSGMQIDCRGCLESPQRPATRIRPSKPPSQTLNTSVALIPYWECPGSSESKSAPSEIYRLDIQIDTGIALRLIQDMADQEAKGYELEKKADKKIQGWNIFGSKYDDAADLYEKAGNVYKIGKSWDKAGSAYVKLAGCHLKLQSKHEGASAYVDAANCYKKTNTSEAVNCLSVAVNLFMEIGRLSMAAKHYKEIGEIYEAEEKLELALDYFERAAELYQGEEVTSTANQCQLKVAQFAAQLEKYSKAVQIYEDVAQKSINNNLLKYSVKGYLLNAGLCLICNGDTVAINNSLEKYQELDPTFSGTRECKFLADLAAAIDEEDVEKFTDVVKEFDSMTRLSTGRREVGTCGSMDHYIICRSSNRANTTSNSEEKRIIEAKSLECGVNEIPVIVVKCCGDAQLDQNTMSAMEF
ncbi:hypothetical protein KI387_034512, partial [Taxus chinensis]